MGFRSGNAAFWEGADQSFAGGVKQDTRFYKNSELNDWGVGVGAEVRRILQ